MKVAIVGDSFIDEYRFGKVERISPEAPVPIIDVERTEIRAGGALNVAINLMGLGIIPVVFTIIDDEFARDFDFEIISPKRCQSLRKTRIVAQRQQLLRIDEPSVYRPEDLEGILLPNPCDFEVIAFVDYDKGFIKGGKATIVDSKKKDLSVFKGTEILKINQFEFAEAKNPDFPQAFITRAEKGIDYYENGKFVENVPADVKEVIDVTGAGDTVMSILIFCLLNGIRNPRKMMELANKAAGIVISRFGTSAISLDELFDN